MKVLLWVMVLWWACGIIGGIFMIWLECRDGREFTLLGLCQMLFASFLYVQLTGIFLGVDFLVERLSKIVLIRGRHK